MPTLYFPCPQCDRPLDADPAYDGPTVQCPCCDRVVEVPNPRMLGRPIAIWFAAALTALVPASWAPLLLALAELLPAQAVLAVPVMVGVGTLICLLPAIALIRGKRAGWGGSLAVACVALAIGLGMCVTVLPIAMAMGMSPESFLRGLLVAVVAGALIVLLILPVVRAWCDE